MKIPMKLNRSHLIVSVGSMVFVMVVLSLLGYLKFSEGYESPEALEDELKELMNEMTATPTVQGLITQPEEETPVVESEPMVEEDEMAEDEQMNMMAPGPMAM